MAAPEMFVEVGGVHKSVAEIGIEVGGVWKTVTEVWNEVGGGWKKSYQAVTGGPTSQNFSSITTASTVAPQVFFNTDGTVQIRNAANAVVAGGSWYLPTTAGIGNSYWIKVQLGGGSAAINGGSDLVNSVIALSVQRNWGINAPAPFADALRILNYFIYSDAGGTTQVGSGTITLHDDRT